MFEYLLRIHKVEEDIDIEVEWDFGRWWDKMDSEGYQLLDKFLAGEEELVQEEPALFRLRDCGDSYQLEIGVKDLDLFAKIRMAERLERFITEEFEIINNGY